MRENYSQKISLRRIHKAKLTCAALAILMVFSLCAPSVSAAETQTYTVKSGDTLWKIAQTYATTVAELKRLNSLTSDTITVGQKLVVSVPASDVTKMYIIYTVQKGDTLGKLAEKFGTDLQYIRSLNGKWDDTIIVGQKLKIPANYTEYTVKSGDTLWKLALAYGTTVDRIMIYSDITFTDIRVGQILKIPAKPETPDPVTPPSSSTEPTVTYFSYTVVKGDTLWDLSIKFGIPMAELLKDNGLNTESTLNLGQTLKVAKHNVPVTPTAGAKYGEYLDWWTQAQYVVPIGKTVKVTDFDTGKSFYVKRTIGAGHADSEPLTASDTAAAKAVFGGYTWTPRAVIVEVDGRRIAASMSFYPHDVSSITDNNFIGHFDLYFANCIRHVDGQPDPAHQKQVERAAGR